MRPIHEIRVEEVSEQLSSFCDSWTGAREVRIGIDCHDTRAIQAGNLSRRSG